MSKKRAYIRKRRSVHLRCRQKAENARKVRSRQKPVQSPESASVTFQAAATLWHRTNVARYKGATAVKYENLLRSHILPELGARQLEEINTLLLADFMNAKLHCGRLDHSGGLSSSYVRSMMLLVLDIMEFAAAEGLCPPVKTTLQTPAANRREVVILDTDALRRLETYLLAKPDITGTGILISLHTGLRISEVCALRWEDIDFRKAVLHVRSTVARVRGTDGGTATRLIIDTPKTKSSLRDIPLSRQLMAVLLPLYEKRRSEYVISDKSGFVSPRTYEYRFHRVLDRCGLPSINYHALRHTFATRCIELGVDVKTLSEILKDPTSSPVWEALIDSKNLTFGVWANDKIVITHNEGDETSPIKSKEYFVQKFQTDSEGKKAPLTAKELAQQKWTDIGETTEFTPNQQLVVYLKITDMAGNVTYLSTNGLVVDNERPHEEFTAPEIVRVSGLTNNKIYNGDVSVVVSANDPVENGVYSGLKQVTYTVYNGTVYNEKDVTQQGVLYSWDGKAPCCQSKEGMGFTVDAKKNNSNDVHILLTAEDNAGNVTSMEYSIKIDITKPIINIEYDKNAADSGTFFRESRRATITVKERNFDDSLVNITLRATNDGADIALPTVSGWTSSGDLHTATIEYTAEGDYTFAIACTDQAGNPNEPVYYADGTVAPTAFTIDKTRPTISVTYDNNSALNGNYYNANRTATVVVTEHNFDASRVNITLRATDDGADIALPTVSGWTSSGDRHTATIAYRRDGLYTFDIDVTDKAGNTSADFTEQTFYVDTTAPTLEITGVADRSANNGDIIPVVSYSDTNYDDAQVNITLTGAMRKGVALDGSYADQHNGKVFTFKNFAKEKEVDDIYTLAATLTDKAGNTTEKTILFSANRFGSTYALSAATDQLNGSYVQTPQDVVVTETNPDALQNIRITLFKNNQTIILQEGTDYRIEVRGGNGQWYEYIYTVLAKNFADDGVYRLTFYSEDAAGNIAENTLDTKKQEIGFGVDKTKPNMVVTNLESDTTYPLENLTVSLSAGDNLLLQSVVVYLDDYSKAYKTWTAEEVAAIVADQGEFTFDIPGDSTGAHQVKIVCTDAAGNEQTEEITNFYVTTNLFVRYYNNKPLFFGSIAAVVVIAGVVIALAAGKKKKNDKEK